MFCSKCGAKNDDTNIYCSKCGEKLKNINKIKENKVLESLKKINNYMNKFIESLSKDKKKLGIFLVIMIGIIVVNIGIYVHRNNKDINAFKNAFNNEKYEEAKKMYSNAINNDYKNKKSKFNQKVDKYLDGVINELEGNFINDKDKSDCSKELKALDEMYYYKSNSEKINKSKEHIKNWGDSRKAFINGIKLQNNKNYFYALEQFNNVIKDDENYNKAQNHIKNIVLKAKEEMIKQCEGYFNSKEYNKAIYGLKNLAKCIPKDRSIKQRIEVYEKEREKFNQVKLQEKKNRKNNLLSKVSKHKDKVSQDITYVPKPYDEKLNIGEGNVIFYPYLRGEIGSDILKLIAGFNQEDWIFMNNIVCNADGEIFELKFNPLDRNSEVGFGTGVYEWIEIPVLEDTPLSEYNTNFNMVNNLKRLGKAKKALIKFQGDTRAFDYELTNSQKSTLLDVVELHELCKGI